MTSTHWNTELSVILREKNYVIMLVLHLAPSHPNKFHVRQPGNKPLWVYPDAIVKHQKLESKWASGWLLKTVLLEDQSPPSPLPHMERGENWYLEKTTEIKTQIADSSSKLSLVPRKYWIRKDNNATMSYKFHFLKHLLQI